LTGGFTHHGNQKGNEEGSIKKGACEEIFGEENCNQKDYRKEDVTQVQPGDQQAGPD
jgi:hypothetical protein